MPESAPLSAPLRVLPADVAFAYASRVEDRCTVVLVHVPTEEKARGEGSTLLSAKEDALRKIARIREEAR